MLINVGQRIREAREDLGMQQTVLARRVGVARNTIGRYESGEREPSVSMLEKIAHELRVEPADLLKEPAPLDEAPPETERQVAAEAMPGISGHALRVRIGEDAAGTHVEVTKTSFFELMRSVKAGRLSEEEAWQRFQEEAG